MNVLLLSLLYPQETMKAVAALSKDGVQNQIDSYQHALIEGLDACLAPGERLDIVNALPVGVFPTRYRRLFLRGGLRDGRIRELGGVNLPWFKQKGRERKALKEILRWAAESADNRTLLLYTLYRPYLRAAARAKKEVSDLRAAVIVTDLPNDWGLSSGRKGVLKKAEQTMGESSIQLCHAMDGFVLLTASMGEVLPIEGKPATIVEGLIQQAEASEMPVKKKTVGSTDHARPVALYTGTLNRELGIGQLLDAFAGFPECELWLCGKGDMEAEVREAAAQNGNIRFLGFVPREEALRAQAGAALLVNPRSPAGRYTRYSFPSKTLEYLRSGKPVLCYRLDGIPPEYDRYLYYIDGEGPEAIRRAVKRLLAESPEDRRERGRLGAEYVREHKNPRAQCGKVVGLLRSLKGASAWEPNATVRADKP